MTRLQFLTCLFAAGLVTTGAHGQPRPDAVPLERQDTEVDPEQLLDADLFVNPAGIAGAQARATQRPPQTQDPAVLARFYLQRGKAQQLVGHESAAWRDLNQAVTYARRATGVDRAPMFVALADAEASRNNMKRAIALIREALDLTPANQRGRRLVGQARLARFLAQAGDVDAAEQVLDEAEDQADAVGDRSGRQRRQGQRQGGQNPSNRRPGATGPALGRGGGLQAASSPIQRALQREIPMAEVAIAMMRGRYEQAESVQRAMMAQLPSDGDAETATLRRGLATILRFQGRLAEAETEARAALVGMQKRFGVNSVNTATALLALASILSDQGRNVEAETLARKGLELVRATGRNGAGARVALANILVAQGRWAEAVTEFTALRQGFADDDSGFNALLPVNLNLPLALLKTGQVAEALARFKTLADTREKSMGDKHYATAEARGFHALALAASGDAEAAGRAFAAAVPILLERSRASNDDGGTVAQREQNLRMILEGYVDLLADLRGTPLAQRLGLDPVAEGFRLADAARDRSVARAVAESGARAAARNPALAQLARAEQDAQKQIEALNGLLANAISARTEDRDEAAIRALRARIDALRDERGRTVAEIERRFPDYARLIDPKPATLASARAALRPGEAMVAFFAGERRTYVWAFAREGAVAFAAAPLGRDGLAEAIGHLREALEPDLAVTGDVPAFDTAAAHRLYAQLLQPVAPGWGTARHLLVVPHGALAQLPLTVLPTEAVAATVAATDGVPFSQYRKVPWLARQAAVTQLPTVAALASLRALPPGRPNRKPFVGFGDPWFSKEQASAPSGPLTTRGGVGGALAKRASPRKAGDYTADLAQLPRLPDTAQEVSAIATTLRAEPARDVYLGSKASESAVGRANLADYRVVMFATHGLIPGDLAGLTQPALALSAPAVTGEPGDGLLTVENILALKLDADWVVLSACNTAAAQGAGAEAVSGLGRAFFYAGTRALLVSNWPVETTSARTITSDLFRRQAETPTLARAEALQQAMLALIDGPGYVDASGNPVFSYAHPIFWAPFSLVGDGGTPAARR